MAHDASLKSSLGCVKLGRVKICDNVFIGAGAIVLPGVKIGSNSIIGAGSVVTHDIPENSVAVGNPALVIENLDDYVKKQKQRMKNKPYYTKEYRFDKRREQRDIQSEIKHNLDEKGYGFAETF